MTESELGRDSVDKPFELDRPVSRRQLIGSAGMAGATLFLAGCGSSASSSSKASTAAVPQAAKLASGKVGGPTGFAGCERYQYGADDAAGRAMLALRAMTNSGRSPITLNMRLWNGEIGQLNVPFPKGAPAVAALLEQETGVKLNLISDTPDDNEQKNLESIATHDGSFNLAQTQITDNGDYAEAGFLVNLDAYVAKYQPDWLDPYWGLLGGTTTEALMQKYNGSVYAVSVDGDYQVWAYRIDLLDNATNQRDFKAKYGYDLTGFPQTWQQHDDVAAFFTQPSKSLYGSADLKNPAWGYVNWMMRYVSTGNPNRQYFDSNARPLINSPEGIQATQEYVKSLAWTYPDAISKGWPEQYAAMGAGQVAMASMFSNCTKFITAGSPLDKGFGKYIRTSLAPGRMVNGALVRRSVIYFNSQFGVNAFSDSKLWEASYLVLQWLSSGHIAAWYCGNPAGYFDPHSVSELDDPLVQGSYKPYGCDELKIIIPHTAPPIAAMEGANEYTNTLDVNTQKALAGQISAEEAMAQTASSWDATTSRIGVSKQMKALAAQNAAWPTGLSYT
jgi:multiple sugar transport system substrate-binding protein